VDVSGGPDLTAVVRTLQDRSHTMLEMADGTVFYYAKELKYEEESVTRFLTEAGRELCAELASRLETADDLSHDAVAAVFEDIRASRGVKLKDVAQPARFALTGGAPSPAIYDVIGVLGREESVKRIRRALEL